MTVTAPIKPPGNGGIVPPYLQFPVTLPVLPGPSVPIPPVVVATTITRTL
mgnify:CR=1 FL=1